MERVPRTSAEKLIILITVVEGCGLGEGIRKIMASQSKNFQASDCSYYDSFLYSLQGKPSKIEEEWLLYLSALLTQ